MSLELKGEAPWAAEHLAETEMWEATRTTKLLQVKFSIEMVSHLRWQQKAYERDEAEAENLNRHSQIN